jgi:aspartyl-tRNA(Asn)/glutamyl-tRNA(Gln) amidotransferase subunit A
MISVFKEVDAILTPATPNTAFPIDESLRSNNDAPIYLNDVFAIPASIAGAPAMSLPAARDENGLPFGLQLVAKHFDEQTMFNIAYALEREFGL